MRIRATRRQATPTQHGVSRRALIGGAGATVLGLGALTDVHSASAAPAHPTGVGPRTVHPDAVPFPTSIASAPHSGYTYEIATMYEFRPFDPAAQPTWGGYGVYTAGMSTALRAFFDLPPGVVVRDVEWYVRNGGSSDCFADLYQYAAGNGSISSLGAIAQIAPGSGVTATRVTVPPGTAGPFPTGSKLLAGITTPTDSSVQINGVRVGFSKGHGTLGLLPAPIRAYDSRSAGGIVHANTTRVITLPADIVYPGVTGVLANITATGSTSSGYLKVYPANQPVPAASALNFHSDTIANALVVGVSNSRQIKVYASRAVHVVVDITGVVA